MQFCFIGISFFLVVMKNPDIISSVMDFKFLYIHPWINILLFPRGHGGVGLGVFVDLHTLDHLELVCVGLLACPFLEWDSGTTPCMTDCLPGLLT